MPIFTETIMQNNMKRSLFCICASALLLMSCNVQDNGPLPRGKASAEFTAAMDSYLAAVSDADQDLHSIMVLKDGKVLFEKWMSLGKPD